MAVAAALCAGCAATAHEAQDAATLAVARVPMDAAGGEAFRAALAEDGIVALTDIPGLRVTKALAAAHVCVTTSDETRTMTFADGTSRRTIAGVTAGADSKPLDAGCEDLAAFRQAVSNAAGAFVSSFASAFPVADPPLLHAADPSGAPYGTLEDVVSRAEHLDHFHAYTRTTNSNASTIDLHADAGMFIAFVPGLMVDQDGVAHTGGDAGAFYVQRRDGTVARADFGETRDGVLVFMLGDGVDHYIAPKLAQPHLLRGVPHAMSMPSNNDEGKGMSRMWFGRMFLPPSEALSEKHGISFGEVRRRAVEGTHDNANGIGGGISCSRKLAEVEGLQCKDNQMYCWMRCMDFTEEANPETCGAQNLGLKCASQRDQVWVPEDSHGDYEPTCTNSTEAVSPPPTIPPRADTCNDTAKWIAFLDKESYPNSQELVKDKLFAMWRVTEDGMLNVRMVFDGIAGWLALGHENVGGGHNGMNGAHIVMGINDPDPDIFGAPYVGTGVDEYVIHHKLSAFRHWSTPTRPRNITDSAMTVTACHTAMTFKTVAVAGLPFKSLSEGGSHDRLIWAVHEDTFLKGYHGYGNRGKMNVSFSGEYGHKAWVNPWAAPAGGSHDDGNGHSGHDHDHSGHDHDHATTQATAIKATAEAAGAPGTASKASNAVSLSAMSVGATALLVLSHSV